MLPPNSQIKILRYLHRKKDWISKSDLEIKKGYSHDDIFELYCEEYIMDKSPKGQSETYYKITSKGIAAVENTNQSSTNLWVSIIAAIAGIVSVVLTIVSIVLTIVSKK